MSCQECDNIQETGGPVAYIRIGDGNVMLVGCADHVLQLIQAWRVVATAMQVMELDEQGAQQAMAFLNLGNIPIEGENQDNE